MSSRILSVKEEEEVVIGISSYHGVWLSDNNRYGVLYDREEDRLFVFAQWSW